MTQARPSGLGRAATLMASGSLVSRALGIVRNALLGVCIGGMGAVSDAFQTANTLPNTIFMLLQSGVLTAVLMPQLTRALRREGDGKAMTDALLTAIFALVGVVTVVAMACADPLVTLMGLRGPAHALGVAFAYWCLPQIFFYALYAVLSQVLNVRDRFGLVMWTPAFANLVQIAGMGVFLALFTRGAPPQEWSPLMVGVLAGSATLGIVVQALPLAFALPRAGYRWRPTWRLRGYGFRAAGKVAVWMGVAVVIAQLGGVATQAAINVVAGRARAAGEIVAGLFVYQQAFTIFMVPHGVITVSILTALLPRMTRAVQEGDVGALRGDLDRGLALPLVTMVPISALLVALALPASRILNPWLDLASVEAIASAFAVMSVGLVAYAVVGLQQRYSTAREDGRTYLVFQGIVTVIQVVFAAAILALAPGWGVTMVAVGQTVSNGVAALVFLVVAQRQTGGLPLRRLAGLTARLLGAAVPAGLAAFGLLHVVIGWLGLGIVGSLVALALGALGFGLVFLGLAALLRIHQVTDAVRGGVRRLRRS
ncbi:MAG TPA: lipid II flippase MurJ [Propioniciclava sp.]|uniref:murein biosynthesis integral membrane protein MurJ n=1 Tax=Propioniciclava sp. TaxID=2038686 RepID=UPI002CAA3D4B|nr:lipid II flippase MurJ [Propioniciclava sp.]HRL48819.1 lipid II flippase MurJ [Propioniciclava sp.]HRL80898.1 lipid II flippase MurJ [Propioniciclava sp.]